MILSELKTMQHKICSVVDIFSVTVAGRGDVFGRIGGELMMSK